MKVLKYELLYDNEYVSILIQVNNKMAIWFDVHLKDLSMDWNKYIFFNNNEEDKRIKEYQNSSENFMECCSIAMDFIDNKLKL